MAPLTPAVARASAGALEHLPVAQVTNLVRALETLKKERGYWVHAADPTAEARSLRVRRTGCSTGDSCWCSVRRGKGVRPGVRAAVDVFVRIPMAGVVESLNVASAAAVVLFEWARPSSGPAGRSGDAERA